MHIHCPAIRRCKSQESAASYADSIISWVQRNTATTVCVKLNISVKNFTGRSGVVNNTTHEDRIHNAESKVSCVQEHTSPTHFRNIVFKRAVADDRIRARLNE